jgi:hypothetical protein
MAVWRRTLKARIAVIYGPASHNCRKPNLNWIHFLPWREFRKAPPPPPRKEAFSVVGYERMSGGSAFRIRDILEEVKALTINDKVTLGR